LNLTDRIKSKAGESLFLFFICKIEPIGIDIEILLLYYFVLFWRSRCSYPANDVGRE
jgi:hypothetical protein